MKVVLSVIVASWRVWQAMTAHFGQKRVDACFVRVSSTAQKKCMLGEMRQAGKVDGIVIAADSDF